MILHVQQRQDFIRGRREKRKQAKKARWRRQILRYFFLFALVAVGASAFRYLPWSLADADRDIAVKGNKVVSVEQVRGALSYCVGKPLYKLNPAVMEQRVKSLEVVRYAFVRRYLFPHPHLVVEVLEEFPWATLASEPGQPPHAVISETGRVIPISQFPSVIQPKFLIYGSSDLRLNTAQVAQWAAWTNYIAAQTGQVVDSVDMRVSNDVRVQDGEFYLRVGSADSTLTRRLGRLASVVPALGDLRDRLQYIDLSLDNNVPLKVAEKPKTEPKHDETGLVQTPATQPATETTSEHI